MIRSVLSLRALDGRGSDVVDLFDRAGILPRAHGVEGCRSAELWRDGDDVIVMATWDDESAYQRWIAHPERADYNDELSALLKRDITADVVGAVYRLELAASAAGTVHQHPTNPQGEQI